MTTLLIDDERLARVELQRLLRAHPSVEILGEAENAEEALKRIVQLRPDMIFLDIQMPGKDGFMVITELAGMIEKLPYIVFATAFDDYAVRAFEVSALDYLMKPIDPARLAHSIAKAEAAINGVSTSSTTHTMLDSKTLATNTTEREILNDESRIFVKEGDHYVFVRVGEIVLWESEGNYTRIFAEEVLQKSSHTATPKTIKALLPRSLSYLEERLDPKLFFRASRSHIVNLRAISHIESWFGGGLLLKLRNGTTIEMSRRQAQRFREIMMP